MSQFYGTLTGSRGEATRCGSKASGITTYAASWAGAVRVHVFERDGVERFEVSMVRWQGRGEECLLAEGEVGKASTVRRAQ